MSSPPDSFWRTGICVYLALPTATVQEGASSHECSSESNQQSLQGPPPAQEGSLCNNNPILSLFCQKFSGAEAKVPPSPTPQVARSCHAAHACVSTHAAPSARSIVCYLRLLPTPPPPCPRPGLRRGSGVKPAKQSLPCLSTVNHTPAAVLACLARTEGPEGRRGITPRAERKSTFYSRLPDTKGVMKTPA